MSQQAYEKVRAENHAQLQTTPMGVEGTPGKGAAHWTNSKDGTPKSWYKHSGLEKEHDYGLHNQATAWLDHTNGGFKAEEMDRDLVAKLLFSELKWDITTAEENKVKLQGVQDWGKEPQGNPYPLKTPREWETEHQERNGKTQYRSPAQPPGVRFQGGAGGGVDPSKMFDEAVPDGFGGGGGGGGGGSGEGASGGGGSGGTLFGSAL